jgi:hypothetical protein
VPDTAGTGTRWLGAALSGRETAKVMQFAFTTGRGFVPVDELRELVCQVQEARPTDNAA